MLTEAEQRRIIGAGRGAPAVVRGHRRIDAVFRARVRENPDAVAVSMNGQELTYQELDSRSDRLARALAAAGVGAGDHVGVCLERSLDLVLCLLAVVKAGAAYVPLDPDYPAGRLTYIADNADLAVAVADADVADIFARVLTLDELEAAATDSSSTLESVSTEATDTAYIIYTSGSTGRPKGVAVSHANVVGLIDATADDFGLRATDTWTMFHSAAFDFSVWEIWGCLLTGARLVVVPYWVSRSPVEFLGLLEKNRVSVLSQTPSAFAQLINAAAERSTALSTRLVILGGEPLDTRMVLRWFDIRPETTCRVVNMYGITETTVHVTAHTVTRRAAVAGSRSVGRPLPGWHVYVMDRAGRPLPFDVPGEIWVGGVGVSKGYVNATGDEGARFAADPFADGVVYRSGDWGQLTADGQLVHRGRIDSQVKVRGFRIELEEIRSVLLADPVVRAAAVVVRHNDIEDAATARIDAYAVLRGAGDAGTLRRNLSERLPTYMMPATISVLDELPLTVNGKVDTARLPAPRLSSTRASEAPRPQLDSSMIARLAELWSEMFGAPVAPDDDFFELGGNSLLAVRLLADLGEATLTVADLYRHPTIRRLAGLLDAAAVAPTG
ncbi:non-ribosomal peptide synthetase [Nocardia sp. NPDC050712]|uniref:non-ribosomal peptide synthetase n=1 Tax=Nocardia sp. NPDC050712 TaxID=3155518 RepID=UPI0033E7AD13